MLMFTLEQIKTTHSKVKSGADFPKYVEDLIDLGIEAYSTYVADGHSEYFGENDYNLKSEIKYSILNIADKADSESFINCLKGHQKGETDYMTFCNDCSKAGVEMWMVDTKEKTCTYYDRFGNKLLEEKIPTA
jgi:uncharacterized protein YbcV (DUF1398 family)